MVGISTRWPALLRLAAASLSGALIWASFPPLGQWWSAIVGVGLLIGAIRGTSKRLAASMGFVHGMTFWVLLMTFVRVFGIDAWLILSVGESLFFILMGLALRAVGRLRWWPLAAPAVWVGQEALRDREPFGGFPWGRLADAQAGGPIAHLAAIGGAPLVSFTVALAGSLLAASVQARGRRPIMLGSSAWSVRRLGWSRSMTWWFAATVGVILIGGAVPLPTAGTTTGGPATVTAALVQGNVPRLGLSAFAQRYAVTRNQMHETEALGREIRSGKVKAPDMVLWPENSSDNDPYVNFTAASMINKSVAAVGVPILVGAVLNAPDNHLENAGIVWSPTTGPGQVYLKQHLLPFGEYLPFRSVLSKWFSDFALLPRDFVPGHSPGLLTIGPAKIADTICFEIADDGVVRRSVRAGGRIIVEQTNDASYEHAGDTGDGGESAQQLQIARLRAIESGRAVLVVSTSGLSAVISPNGTVEQRSSIFAPATLIATVPMRDPLTIADRIGAWPEYALCALAVIALIAAAAQRRRSAPEPSDAVAETPVRPTAAIG